MKQNVREGLVAVGEAKAQGMFEGLWWMKQMPKKGANAQRGRRSNMALEAVDLEARAGRA